MNVYDQPNSLLKILPFLVILLVISACGQQDSIETSEIAPTEIPASTETPVPTETPTPTATPIPTPDVAFSVGSISRGQIPISAGESTEIQFQIAAVDDVDITSTAEQRGTVVQQDTQVYEYTAPEEGGGVDTVRFEVSLFNDPSVIARVKIEFRVIDLNLESPLGEVPCDSRATCGFVAQGTVDGITDDMAVVLFVKPDDSDVWSVHRAGEVTDEDAWEVQATVRREPVIAGTNFVVRAMVLPEEDALLLPSEVSEPPDEPLGKSDISQIQVVSGRARLGQSDGQVAITSPVPGADVPHGESVSILGNATGVPPDSVLWAMVYAPEGKYWPQSPTGCQTLLGTPIKEDGQWEIPNILFGGEGELQFDVAVLLTDSGSEIDEFFKEYLKTACQTGDYPGLAPSELPAELSEAASVTVIARD